MEEYTAGLHRHLLEIQKQETKLRDAFTRRLSELSSTAGDKKSKKKDERDIYVDFETKLKKLKKRRRNFRQMLFDANNERKKLVESMTIQKTEEEHLRRKLQKLSSVDTHTAESIPKFDFFTLAMIPLQIITLIIFWIATTYDDTNAGNLGPANRFVFFLSSFFFPLSFFMFLLLFLFSFLFFLLNLFFSSFLFLPPPLFSFFSRSSFSFL